MTKVATPEGAAATATELTFVKDVIGIEPPIELIFKCVYIPYIGAVDVPNNSFALCAPSLVSISSLHDNHWLTRL